MKLTKREKEKITLASLHGYRGQVINQRWLWSEHFKRKYWRSLTPDEIYNLKNRDYLKASRVARWLSNPNGQPVTYITDDIMVNNHVGKVTRPVLQYFTNKEDQYKPWPILEEDLTPFVEYLPDYHNDLNALAEVAAKVLPNDKFELNCDKIIKRILNKK